MPYDESLAVRVREALARKRGVEEKKMFGGLAFILFGNFLLGVRKDSLLARVGVERSDEALQEPYVSEFRISGRGSMKGWIVIDMEGIEDDDQLSVWIEAATQFVEQLPPK